MINYKTFYRNFGGRGEGDNDLYDSGDQETEAPGMARGFQKVDKIEQRVGNMDNRNVTGQEGQTGGEKLKTITWKQTERYCCPHTWYVTWYVGHPVIADNGVNGVICRVGINILLVITFEVHTDSTPFGGFIYYTSFCKERGLHTPRRYPSLAH